MQFRRILKHLFYPDWLAWQAFPSRSRRAIERAISESEARHGGEIRFAVEPNLPLRPLLRGMSARERALEIFSQLRVWDTEQNNGVLIYLLLADRDVEIVADRGLNGRVEAAEWEAICRQMEADFRRGAYEAGVRQGIQAIGAHLARHFPPPADNRNELPDRPTLIV
ncbi:TLP18.3/Psb32/MOLO-1 phosphatase superfamily protein [Sulfuritortus calidifontis]|uniref:TLP18.3/Psb32/MOLO-1 phosphatase superfamily protein n=1 Tax=Sulfuritortus calidifontis TaxID=1914471 RepID=A0A4R3JV70_9PROT|nr:TPM domain-containing protein [Sulfuritortus calidifontis]TCS70566.1 TLP18.3/Psb32/MOLO-1 phosphatase superfamily protein [Sulfuritortus calidifontis]